MAPGSLVVLPFVATLSAVTFHHPLILLAIPIVALALAVLFFRSVGGRLSRRRRWLFFASRLVIATLLITAAAGPYVVTVAETTEDPSVTLLVDESASMDIYDVDAEAIAAGIEDQGVPVERTVIASGNESAIGDGVIGELEREGNLLLFTDGQTTHGRSLPAAGELAFEHDARLHAVRLSPDEPARAVRIHGPRTTSIGIGERFLVSLDGAALGSDAVPVTVTIDGETVLEDEFGGEGDIEFTHEFTESGSHEITARIESDDRYDVNDVYRKTIRVVERPAVLYVSRVDYPLESYLDQLYDVTRAESIPDEPSLEEYYAVVVHDVAAGDLGDVAALSAYANDGNGVVVVGGDNSFDNGGYASSSIAHMLPVRMGEHHRSADIVLVIDISGSAGEELPVMQSLALDVLEQTGSQNRVGLIAFDSRAHPLIEPTPLAEGRDDLEDTVLRLQSGGGTNIGAGLDAAGEMLDEDGEVILLTDGIDRSGEPEAAARRLADRDIRVTTVGPGGIMDENVLESIARTTGGTYFHADETTKLRLLFGGEDRTFEGDRLTVVDANHFITTGVSPTADPERANEVTDRAGARLLVATADGTPAVTSWRYGIGRVVTITTFDADGSLGPLLREPDAELVTRSMNWAIADPERKDVDVLRVEDGRVGDDLRVEYRGPDRPTISGLSFVRTEPDRYRATFVPTEAGYHRIDGARYAVNAPSEYAAFGQSTDLRAAVAMADGELFDPDDTEAMAEAARSAATRERELERDLAWLPLGLALVLFLVEVSIRRLQEVYGVRALGG